MQASPIAPRRDHLLMENDPEKCIAEFERQLAERERGADQPSASRGRGGQWRAGRQIPSCGPMAGARCKA
jgi:hypothetical protein